MIVRVLTEPKDGWPAEDCQDAYAISRTRHRFCIADGMTDSAFSREWAHLLSAGMITLPSWRRSEILTWVTNVSMQWREALPANLPWYLSRKVSKRGSFATLAAIDLTPQERAWTNSGRERRLYRAFAIGDSCIFHVRNDRLVSVFPPLSPTEFQHRPVALGTDSQVANESAIAQRIIVHGSWRPGDRFLLMTDALAAYTLATLQQGAIGMRAALPFRRDARAFSQWVSAARLRGTLKDDDTTLLEIRTRG